MGVQVLDVCFAGLALYLAGRLASRKKTSLPPGPPGLPLIGNLLDFPTYAPYKTLGAMSEKYGPVISLSVMGTRYIVLNSRKATNDLLDKMSVITSNRPHFTMGGDLVGWSSSMMFLQYGDTYRKHRKFFRQQIGSKSSLRAFYPIEQAETKQFLRNVSKNSDDLATRCHGAVSSVILRISHGYTVGEDGDPLTEMADKVAHNFSIVLAPGRFLVDTIPILRYLPEWFPGCGFHRHAKQWRKILNDVVGVSYNFVLEHMAMGDAAPSFISRQLQDGVTPEEEEILKWASFVMYLGGSESTPAALHAFFFAMTLHPEVLQKAQAEIDSVIGSEKLPTFEDRNALPYVRAICLELLRWHVVGPFAIHVTTEDIIYEGYLIPKGTCLLGNIWYILSDPETYPDPEVFNPERFLGEAQQPDPREVCFGFGRRSCPGAHLAELTIFTFVAMALATLDVSRCVENGMELVPEYDTTEGTSRHVKPFKCRIVPRSRQAQALLELES